MVHEVVRDGATTCSGAVGTLSPSRAGDFMTCPLLYRFRTIDRLPETSSPAAVRGTVVHKVLEGLFDLPALDRTPARAAEMVAPAWDTLLAEDPTLADAFGEEGPELTSWLVSCRESLERYFALEDPRRLEPADREMYVETLLDSNLLLRGIIDRLDVAPTGQVRVVDYKGLAVDTPLPTPDGWTTMGEVQPGDLVIGSDGRPTRVTLKSGVHHRPCYRITLGDGSSVVADNVHLWNIVSSYRQRQTWRTVATEELEELHREHRDAGRRQSLWVEAAAPLELPDVDLPVDPWLLGAWLGDGRTRGGSLTVGRDDLEDMLTLIKERWTSTVSVTWGTSAATVSLSKRPELCTYGHHDFREPTVGHLTRRCRQEEAHKHLPQWNVAFGTQLRVAGLLGRRHVPPVYLRAGTQQRIDLLRGLMDTDGWWNKKRRRAGFTTTDDGLAADVVQLLRTLGLHPSHWVKPYANRVRAGRNWHVIEFTPTFNPFSLPRKALAVQGNVTTMQATLSRRRTIVSVEPVDTVPTQCIAVDAPDSLYLCGDGFVPTHNTGRAPGPGFESSALFQMKFYALVLWRVRGVVPSMLQLIYLGSGEVVRFVPEERDLLAVERKVNALWAAISRATETGDWRPRRSKLCGWCSHQQFCPEFGGTPPPLPVVEVSSAPRAEPEPAVRAAETEAAPAI